MGYDLFISIFPLEYLHGLYYYDPDKYVEHDYNTDILQISYNHSIYEKICWNHIPDLKTGLNAGLFQCECEKEKLFHILSDFHKRLGSDIYERISNVIKKLNFNGYIGFERFVNDHHLDFETEYPWTPEIHINHFCGILNSFKDLAEKYPNHVFGVYDQDEDKEYFIDNNDVIKTISKKPSYPKYKKKRKYVLLYELGSNIINKKIY